MKCLRIIGGKRLGGSIRISGSKNAALPILAASILADSPVRLSSVPRLDDVRSQRRVLQELGVASTRLPDGDLLLETVDPTRYRASYALVSRMRASFCVLGPLLARRGRAEVSLPGGCNLGLRPVDLHLRALEAMGAEITISQGYVIASAKNLHGGRIDMRGPHGPSVTGTANALCAATRSTGVTTISNAATEPEIEDLGRFLNAMGADIEGLGTDKIVVRGRSGLQGATHRVIPDRIEAGTFLLAVAAAGGSVCVDDVLPEHLSSVLGALDAIGVTLQVQGSRVTIVMNDRPRPTQITCLPFPGMPTDLQPLWMALLARANGRSQVCDTVFPHRFLHVPELCRLGARIQQTGASAMIDGVTGLSGAGVRATDLRAGAALVVAGLTAKGMTTVSGVEHLDRGYVRFEDKLRQLGAAIHRCEFEPEIRDVSRRGTPTGPAGSSSK